MEENWLSEKGSLVHEFFMMEARGLEMMPSALSLEVSLFSGWGSSCGKMPLLLSMVIEWGFWAQSALCFLLIFKNWNIVALQCLFLAVLSFRCCMGFSLVAISGGYLLFAVCGLLTAEASLVAWSEHGLQACDLSSCSSRALEHRLSSFGTGTSLPLQHVGSSWTRNGTHVSCIGRWVLYHWTTRKAPSNSSLERNINSQNLKFTCVHAQLCLTRCDPIDCSPPGSSVHGISHARILEWVAISFSRESSWPWDWTPVSCIDRQILYLWATWKAHTYLHSNSWKLEVSLLPGWSGSCGKCLQKYFWQPFSCAQQSGEHPAFLAVRSMSHPGRPVGSLAQGEISAHKGSLPAQTS